jgi:hypothetical protein
MKDQIQTYIKVCENLCTLVMKEMQIKAQWDATKHSQTTAILNMCEDVEEQELLYSAGGSINGYKHFRKQIDISLQRWACTHTTNP